LLSHHIIPNFVTDDERSYFLSLADSENFVNHKSTITGKSSALHFLPVYFRGLERISIMKMMPNAVQDWHIDGVNLKRHSVIIHPLSDNYAPLMTVNGEVNTTAIINTQVEHAVFNNDSIRINLQIPIDLPFEILMKNKKHTYWNMIEGLYI
jgi:hypothetical protein